MINRSTRQLQLTDEGLRFYQRSSELLTNLEELEQSISHLNTCNNMVNPIIRINCSSID